jgi:predicted DNA-binding helix-hairpin-helix protein
MSKIIAFTNELGGVSICVPTGELSIQEVKAKDTPLNSIIMDASELPEADNDFFNSWELVDGVVSVNIEKAKEQTKDRLRAERAPLLAAQDVAFQRALEESKDTATIVAEKQRLRDITNLVDGCKTTEELRGLSV